MVCPPELTGSRRRTYHTLRPRSFYAAAMAGPLIFIATNRLKPDALDAERSRVPELVSFVEREEPQVIGFNEYVSDAGDEVTVVQIHPDAASIEKHIGVVADHARRAYEETLDRTVRIQVFGELPESIVASLREQASAGVEIVFNSEHLGGFLRP